MKREAGSVIACLFVPLFPLAARLRSEPELKEEAVAVLEGNGNAARVIAATRSARRTGIQPGMSLPQARARIPKLVARGRDAECERAAQQALLEAAESFSPRIENAGEGVVYVDLEGHPGLRGWVGHSERDEHPDDPPTNSPLTPPSPPGGGRGGEKASPRSSPTTVVGAGLGSDGSDLLRSAARTVEMGGEVADGSSPVSSPNPLLTLHPLPPPSGKRGEGDDAQVDAPLRALARDMIRAAERAGLPARVGVAASKLAARIAAGLPDSPTIVLPGGESAFLAPLPLERLAPEMEIAATLDRWGLRSIGDLAKLPEGEVASRLGEIGRELHASANGMDPRPLEPYVPSPSFCEGMDLEWPLATLEPFLFVAHAALDRLVQRLEFRALACTRLEIALTLDPDGHDARAIALPAPTRDVKTLLTLVRLELEARPPGAAVAGFVFSAHPDRPRRAQLSLFGPAALSPDRLATTIARLAALLGEDRVGSPRTADGHRPERFTLTRYAPPPPPIARGAPRRGRGLLSVRVLRPPVPLEVQVKEEIGASGIRVGAGLGSDGSDLLRSASRTVEMRGEVANGSSPVSSTDAASSSRSPNPLLTPPSPPDGGRGPDFPFPAGEGPGGARSSMEYRHLPRTRDPRVPPEAAHTIVPPLPSGEGSFGPGSFFDLPHPLGEVAASLRSRDALSARDAAGRNGHRHRPLSVQSPPDATPAIAGRVRVASGPWSLEEGWWTEAPVDRDYWDVELSEGGLYRIYRERRGGAWFADGIYD